MLVALQIWDAINDGTAYSCPSLLTSFTVISFANLKKYRFSYWFGFPAIHSDPSWVPADSSSEESITQGTENTASHPSNKLSNDETTTLFDAVQTWRYSVDARQHGFFLAKRVRHNFNELNTRDDQGGISEHDEDNRQRTPGTPGLNLGFTWKIASLSGVEQGFFDKTDSADRFVCFADPSTYPKAPGWMLRNLLVLVRRRWKFNDIQVLCYRDTQSRRDSAQSIILRLKTAETDPSQSADGTDLSTMPKVTGWERNQNGKLAGRMADLTEYMDPRR